MSRLVLHIGAHKTATSYIQDVLTLNDELLLDHGIVYPRVFPNRAHHVLTTPWRPEVAEQTGFTAEKAYATYRQLVDEHAKSDRTVVLSGEPWSRVAAGVTDFEELARLVEGFDDVVLLYVARHPWELLQSLYLQFTKDWQHPPMIEKLLEDTLQGTQVGGVTLDHERVLDLVCTGFDESQVQFANYEVIKSMPMGVLTPIMELCGKSELPEGFQPAPRSNVSPDPLATYVTHRMKPNVKPRRDTINRIRRAIDAHFGENAKTTVMTRAEAEQLHERYDASDRRVFDRLSGHSPYLKRQEMVFSDSLIQRDQIDVDFMITLTRRLLVALEQK